MMQRLVGQDLPEPQLLPCSMGGYFEVVDQSYQSLIRYQIRVGLPLLRSPQYSLSLTFIFYLRTSLILTLALSSNQFSSLALTAYFFTSLFPFLLFFPFPLSLGFYSSIFYIIMLSLIRSAIKLKKVLYLMDILNKACWNYVKLRPTQYSLGTSLFFVIFLKMQLMSLDSTRKDSQKAVKKYLHVSKMTSWLCVFSVRERWVCCIKKSQRALKLT